MIYHITPFSETKQYGKALNEHIKCFPDDSWICVRDQDTMFLTSTSVLLLDKAIEDNPDCQLFTCATNRSYGSLMSTNADILVSCSKAQELEKQPPRYSVLQGVVPAFLWLFPKSLWKKYPFDDLPIISGQKSFDVRWTRNMNVKKLRIENLYIFHLYRLYKERSDYSHLQK